MQLDAETNTSFLNDDPAEQLKAAEKSNSKKYIQSYASQGIEDSSLDLMRKADKSKTDFVNFMKVRETYIEKMLEEFDFAKDGQAQEVNDLEEA